MSEVQQCPTCSSPVETAPGPFGEKILYRPAPLSPAVLAVALDNEQVARAVSHLATPELRLALASVMLDGRAGGTDPFFTEQDVRDEAEAAARCDGVAAQMRKTGTQFAEAAEFRDLAGRHRKRAMRIMALLPDAVQQKMRAEINAAAPAGPAKRIIQ